MKKLLLTTLCSLILAGMALAQDGSVNWAAIDFAFMGAQTNTAQYSPFYGGGPTGGGAIGAAGGSASLGTGFYFEFLFKSYTGSLAPQPTTFAQLATWTDSGLEASNANVAGRLAPINPNAGVSLIGFSQPGTANTNSILLFGWSANLGSSYATAIADLENGTYGANTYFGVSNTGYLQGNQPNISPGVNLFGNGTVGSSGLAINNSALTGVNGPMQLFLAVPEPTTMALAALGALSLLAARRRKR